MWRPGEAAQEWEAPEVIAMMKSGGLPSVSCCSILPFWGMPAPTLRVAVTIPDASRSGLGRTARSGFVTRCHHTGL